MLLWFKDLTVMSRLYNNSSLGKLLTARRERGGRA